jgi:hypothetical protein
VTGVAIGLAGARENFRESAVVYGVDFFAKRTDARQVRFGGFAIGAHAVDLVESGETMQ